jgi:superfamily I DNA/RNA helicase
MGLNLPKWEELSRDEQIPIVNLPIGGNYVVVGGPGTGKTVLAIYRAARWRRENEAANKVLFLVYNRTLMQYISDSLNSVQLPSSYSETWNIVGYGIFIKKRIKNSFRQLDHISMIGLLLKKNLCMKV